MDECGRMPELEVQLDITPTKLLSYYRGQATTVRARATNGQTVQFPATALQKVVAQDGIHGLFRIEFDEQNKFQRIVRVDGV